MCRLDECLEHRPCAEWYGLLGATHKKLWQQYKELLEPELAARHFRRSMDQYERGQQLEPSSYYCGINLVTMLYLSDDVEHKRLHAAVSKIVVTLGRCSALRPSARPNEAKPELYWGAASGFELAAVTGQWKMGQQAAECMLSLCHGEVASNTWLAATISQVSAVSSLILCNLLTHVLQTVGASSSLLTSATA